jgi:hypothetical protein
MTGWYAVSTRETQMREGGWYEPPEYGRYFVYARAKTARRAKVIALRWMESPFKGMIAERICQYSDRPFAVRGDSQEWLCDCVQCEDTRRALADEGE